MDYLIAQAKESIQQLLTLQRTSLAGLTEKEGEKRLKIIGYNRFVEKKPFALLKLLWDSFFSPLVLLLLVASLISSLLGDFKDFIIIFSIVVLSGCITFYQHFKAENAAEKLKRKVQLLATVIRDGIRREISFERIVPGDIIIVGPGDIVPADGRILDAKDLSIDESTLTGESFPSQKSATFVNKDIHALSALLSLVFAGTHVITGEATICVFATGANTQLGKLASEIVVSKPQTDFDVGVKKLSILMIKLIVLLCVFVFGINALLHHEILSSFIFAVALAVGLTPELMPVILTINLSRGALEMEKKEVIVKYLPAIQNFGSMDVLCTDKTGTLTENSLTLVAYQDSLGKKSEEVLLFGALDVSLKSGIKDPLDHAILRHEHMAHGKKYIKIDELPFDFIRKRASVIVKDSLDHTFLVTKGAPQKVLSHCKKYETLHGTKELTSSMQKDIEKRVQDLNKKGFRVLLVAKKKIERKSSYETSDEHSLTLLGMLIFNDTVKSTVGTTIKSLMQLGVAIKILTGDNELVTQKVCTDVGLKSLGTLIGEDIDTMTDEQLEEKVDSSTIFARLTPSQKERIIQSLKRKNHVVGYLGDGVNDAPPLKAADVGISVNNGSDIARDVADIVLMRKSLSILRDGVQEGRKTHANIFKYIFMSLSSNFGNMISIAIASIFLPFLPLLPMQILLINFLYDFSQITLPTDVVDKETIQKPQKWDVLFLKKFMIVFGPISSCFDICTFIALLLIFHASIPIFRTGWFVESVVSQTLIILLIRTRRLPFFKSSPSIPVVISAVLVICIGFLFTYPPLSTLFTFVRLPLAFYLFLICIIFVYMSAVELGKLWFYRFFSSKYS